MRSPSGGRQEAGWFSGRKLAGMRLKACAGRIPLAAATAPMPHRVQRGESVCRKKRQAARKTRNMGVRAEGGEGARDKLRVASTVAKSLHFKSSIIK